VRLLMIRHGQTPSNKVGSLDTGLPGPGLTRLGTKQAAALPKALAGERIEAVFASVQKRAQLTAAPLAKAIELPVLVRDGLREISAGDLEMKRDRASVDLYHAVSFGWAEGRRERRMPGGENGIEVYERFNDVVNEAAEVASGCVAFFAHGQVLRSWVAAHTDNVGVDYASTHLLHNTGVIVVEGSPADGWRALTWMGQALGGARLDEGAATGPGGEPS
jgi:broad specificity phosphatase PhoE